MCREEQPTAGLHFDSQAQTIAKREVGAGAADAHRRELVEVTPARGLDSKHRIDVETTQVGVARVAVHVHLIPGLQELVRARGKGQRGCVSIRGAERANMARSLHLRRQGGDGRQRLRYLDSHITQTRAAMHRAVPRALFGGRGKDAVIPRHSEQIVVVHGERWAIRIRAAVRAVHEIDISVAVDLYPQSARITRPHPCHHAPAGHLAA